VNFLASKLIQHVLAIGSIKNLDIGSYFAINLGNFLASKLIQHVIAIGSIKNLDTGSYFAISLGNFLASNLIQQQSLKEIHNFAPSFNLRRALS